MASTGGAGASIGGAGGQSVCDSLSAGYQMAVNAAQSCAIGGTGQCQQIVSAAVGSCGCVPVADASMPNAIQQAWQAAGCPLITSEPACAQGPCRSSAGFCGPDPADSTGTRGICTYGNGASGGTGGQADTGGTAGGRGGAAGQAGAAGGAGIVCGGGAALTCGPGDFCDFGDGQCGAGNQRGQCTLAGGALCLQEPVCGCDGNTYSSACAAHENGVDTMSTTSCIPGNGGTGAPCGHDSDCMSGYKCCVTGGTAGSPIACRDVGTGSCPALP